IVLGIPRSFFDEIHAKVKDNFGWGGDRAALEMLCDEYRAMIELITDHPVTDCPRQQLEQAMIAVLAWWNNPRALAYRQAQRIGNGLGTAVNIQAMVFGNRDLNSCTGVAFSSNVKTGEPGLWGEFLVGAQGEDVVNGSVTPLPIAMLAGWNRQVYADLDAIVN